MNCLRSYNNYILDLTGYVIYLVSKIKTVCQASVWFCMYSYYDTKMMKCISFCVKLAVLCFLAQPSLGQTFFCFRLASLSQWTLNPACQVSHVLFCTSFVRLSVNFLSFFSVFVLTVTSACESLPSLCNILIVAFCICAFHLFNFSHSL